MREESSAKAFFEQIRGMRVLVLGDVMLDRYLRGEVKRISPEAPVPVLDLKKSENRLGGAGNVALNLKALGAEPLLQTVVGRDEEGEHLLALMAEQGLDSSGVLRSKVRRSTVKIRLLSGGQHLLRVDKEDRFPLSEEEEDIAFRQIKERLERDEISVILFQDYDKGYLTPSLIEKVLAEATARGIPTAVDPKFRNFYAYRGATLFKPNLKEIRDRLPFAVEPEPDSLKKAAAYLRERLQFTHLLVTLSEHGAFIDDGQRQLLSPTRASEIVDVCGAGDAVISTVTLALAAGLPASDLIRLANIAGAQVCSQVGVVAVDAGRLQADFFTDQALS